MEKTGTKQNKSTAAMEEITERVLSDLAKGVMPWEKDWFSAIPKNASTGKEYRGVNILILSYVRAFKQYSCPAWLTFKQATDLGGRIKKGEKSSEIVFYDILTHKGEELDDQGKAKIESFPLLKVYHVFNLDQTEGLDALKAKNILMTVDPIEEGEKIMADSGVSISFSGMDKAFYSPATDKITLPSRDSFKSTQGLYNTVFHELTHASGHVSRLNRNFSGRFGSEAYAFEELVAELGGSFLSSHIGLAYNSAHSSYIASWLKVLKDDKQAIIHAASHAQRAVDFILKVKHEKKEAAQ